MEEEINYGQIKQLLYGPKNKIYVLKGKDGRIKKIIGSKEDEFLINNLTALAVRQQYVKPSDIVKFLDGRSSQGLQDILDVINNSS